MSLTFSDALQKRWCHTPTKFRQQRLAQINFVDGHMFLLIDGLSAEGLLYRARLIKFEA